MNPILQIIEKFGGLEALEKAGHFKVVNKPYMDLNIDFLGKGPNGHPMIAIAHNHIQNGDVMADPDIQAEVYNGELLPVTFQQDGLGVFQQVYTFGKDGEVLAINLRLQRDLISFLKTWGKNLKEQGFLDQVNTPEAI